MAVECDVLILSNGPGELSTWVRPVVAELVRRNPQARLSVILAPDVNSSGREAEMARALPGVARVQEPKHYLKFLLTGRTADNWDWAKQGIVLFLGGDQGFSAFIARRLGYPIVAYAEWQARWPGGFARFGLREERVRDRSPRERFKGQYQVVGDLMVDAVQPSRDGPERARRSLGIAPDAPLVCLLPGSKAAKLSLGIPLFMGLIEQMARLRPGVHFCLPVAPGLTGEDLARWGRPDNRDIGLVAGLPGTLVREGGREWLASPGGARVLLSFERPAYDLMAASDLAFTTVGANTSELGILGVPMLVLIPTNRWDAMRAWDGLPGLMSNLPGVGSAIASFINKRLVARLGLLSWPNIRAGRMVVPEICRPLTATDLVELCIEWLDDPERRRRVSAEIKQAMGLPGAARAFVDLVEAALAGL
jgi:lipid-A-disaccharide synthase